MDITKIQPTTEIGIKRLAREISRKKDLKHSDALNLAAKAAGYTNFANVVSKRGNLTKSQTVATVSIGLYFTAYWSELNSGRETIYLEYLPQWPQLLTRQQLLSCRALMNFHGQAADHLVLKEVAGSQQKAIRAICHAVRELQFMHATGLKPVQRAHVSFRSIKKNRPELPAADHASAWSTDTGTRVLLDEPYRLTQDNRTLRDQWAQQHQIGIYNVAWSVCQPDMINEMYLVSDCKSVAQQIAHRLGKYLHSPVAESGWKLPSHSYRPLFQSPLQQLGGKPLRAPPSSALRMATKRTIPMADFLLGNSERRPNGRMPLDVHDDVASRLNAIERMAYYRSGVSKRVWRVKIALDEWVQREYNSKELPRDRFSAMYLPGNNFNDSAMRRISPNESADSIKSLEHIALTLSQNYPMCAPLKTQLKQLDLAMQSLRKWIPKA